MNNVLYLGDIMKSGYKKQANYKDSFEDLYLRHDYLKKTNPDITVNMDKYEKICKATAKIMYEKHRMRFNKVGFYYDDILNVTRVYSYSFLNVYSFENNQDALNKFQTEFINKNGKLPTDEEMAKKERNNLINFLRQRLSACSLFCERKSRNIIVDAAKKMYFAYTSKSTPASPDLILEDHTLFGYRMVSEEEMIIIRKKSIDGKLVDEKGFAIIEIESHSKMPLSFYVKMVGSDSEDETEIKHTRIEASAEEKFVEMEDEIELHSFKNKFDGLTKSQKRNKLNTFIAANTKNPKLKEEVKTARKILKELANVV